MEYVIKTRGDYEFVEPVESPAQGNLGWFNSGKTITLNNKEYPLHNYQESQEQYSFNSLD
jgi:hypothetical protein